MLHGLPAELWVDKDWHLNISYTADAGRVAIVHVRRPNRYDLEMIGAASSEASRNAPDLEKLNAAIGLAVDDAKLQAALAPLAWNQDARDEAGRGDEVFRYLKSHGLSLYFRDGADVGTTVLAGYRVNRAGDMDSAGYRGRCPSAWRSPPGSRTSSRASAGIGRARRGRGHRLLPVESSRLQAACAVQPD